MHPSARAILHGQIVLLCSLLICVFLKPHGLAANAGFSYFGTFLVTVIPYSAALLGGAYYCYQAATRITQRDLQPLRWGLLAIVPLLAIIVVTPYSVGTLFDWAHTTAGALLFILQIVLSIWLVWKLHFRLRTSLLLILEVVAGVVCSIYVAPDHGLLLQFEILFQLAFSALMIYSLNLLDEKNAVSSDR